MRDRENNTRLDALFFHAFKLPTLPKLFFTSLSTTKIYAQPGMCATLTFIVVARQDTFTLIMH